MVWNYWNSLLHSQFCKSMIFFFGNHRVILNSFSLLSFLSINPIQIQMSCWIISGENQSIKYRRAYFSAILKQEVGWFDKTDAN